PTLTDGQGLASNSWRLGDVPGETDRVIAWIEPANAPPDTVTFSAEVIAEGAGSTLRIISGSDQKGIERDTLLNPLVVEVRDSMGISVPGVSVYWRVVSADAGTVVQTPTKTDDQGLTSNRWRVGDAPPDTLARDSVIAWIEPEFGEPDTVVFVARVTGIPSKIEILQGAVETDFEYSEPEEFYGDTVFVAPKHWARQPFKGVVRDSLGREVRGAEITWTVTNREGKVGLLPEDGAGEEAVTFNTAEDGAITVWRRACDEEPGEDICSTDGNWIGATLSIEKYPDVVPVTLNALIRESSAP
ncbi:MAG: Ig-like domain-containing protein, partial [marine benthic group bacterium]|nr:Ig-like domain-containing protein [Gemmatimonadota bacterium]